MAPRRDTPGATGDLRARVEELRAANEVPALAAVVVAGDEINAAAAGVRRTDAPDAVADGERFHLGSNAKAITATLAAVAVESGALTWDTRASDVLGVGEPTLAHLLRHSSGLPPFTEDEELAAVEVDGTPREQRRAFAAQVLAAPPVFDPGTAHEYSNAGYAVAAAMVEDAFDEPWEDALRRRIFDPLGMEARVGWPADEPAQPFGHWGEAPDYRIHEPGEYRLPAFIAPAGDVCASAESYGAFLRLHLRGLAGHDGLVSAATIRELHVAHGDAAATRYACGWGVQELAGEVVHAHTGSADTFYAVTVLAPVRERGVGVIASAADERAQRACVDLLKELLGGAETAESDG